MTSPSPRPSPRQAGGDGDDVRERLRGALLAALRSRDAAAVAALRSALASIANAEAVPVDDTVASPTSSQHFAGAAAGLGAGEARPRSLSAEELGQIIRAEIDERLDAACDYERGDHSGRARRLRDEASALAGLIGPD